MNSRLMPPESLAAQIDALKFRVTSSLNGNAPAKGVTLVFTSCEEGEGVTSIASNFAASLAEDPDKAILLMDCNLRNPALRQIFCTDKSLEKHLSDPSS